MMQFDDNHITYLEFKASNIEDIKKFYTETFNWVFKDYGPTYTSFSNSGVHGGFELTDAEIVNGPLVVLYHQNLDQIKKLILKNKGSITKDIFSFPGGRRFHFTDPSGNELAIWSDN